MPLIFPRLECIAAGMPRAGASEGPGASGACFRPIAPPSSSYCLSTDRMHRPHAVHPSGAPSSSDRRACAGAERGGAPFIDVVPFAAPEALSIVERGPRSPTDASRSSSPAPFRQDARAALLNQLTCTAHGPPSRRLFLSKCDRYQEYYRDAVAACEAGHDFDAEAHGDTALEYYCEGNKAFPLEEDLEHTKVQWPNRQRSQSLPNFSFRREREASGRAKRFNFTHIRSGLRSRRQHSGERRPVNALRNFFLRDIRDAHGECDLSSPYPTEGS